MAYTGQGPNDSVLTSNGTVDKFSAYPEVLGLGIGASAGSTAGITFDGTNFLNFYATGTWTPTLFGQTIAGTSTYTQQTGYYIIVGNLVTVNFTVSVSAATGTGNIGIGGLPFTVKNQSTYLPMGSMTINGLIPFPAGITGIVLQGFANATSMAILGYGSSVIAQYVQMTNVAVTYTGSLSYEI